jgi:hypothetical protein
MTNGTRGERKNWYYWIVTRDPENNKPYLLPGGKTEQEARQKGLEQLGGVDFELRRFPTTNMATASAMLKGKRLEKTKSLHTATERLGHGKSLKRSLRKRDRRTQPRFGDGGF